MHSPGARSRTPLACKVFATLLRARSLKSNNLHKHQHQSKQAQPRKKIVYASPSTLSFLIGVFYNSLLRAIRSIQCSTLQHNATQYNTPRLGGSSLKTHRLQQIVNPLVNQPSNE